MAPMSKATPHSTAAFPMVEVFMSNQLLQAALKDFSNLLLLLLV